MTVKLVDHGAAPGTATVEASTANRAAFNAAVAQAVATGCETIELPPGTLWIEAAQGLTSGAKITVPDGKTIRFHGGDGTTIKRLTTTTPQPLAPTSALVWMTANTGVTIEWHDVTFDGNEGACEYDPANRYAEEQSANIKWLPGTGTPNAIRFYRCDVGKNRVGDGYHANTRVDWFMATDCSTTDPQVRRVRADWQFSRYATHLTTMTGIVCNSWESEPSDTPPSARLQLANVYAASVFDLAGDGHGTTRNPIDVQLTNVRCDADPDRAGFPFVNFYFVHGEAANCHFQGIDRIQRCQLRFSGGEIKVQGLPATPAIADPVQVWHDQLQETTSAADGPCYTTFHGVRFTAATGVAAGEYVKIGTVAKASVGGMVRTALINCDVATPLDQVMTGTRAGVIEIRGGNLKARTAILYTGSDADHYNRVHLDCSPLWETPALMKLATTQVTTGVCDFILTGAYDKDRVAVATAHPTATPGATWLVTADAGTRSTTPPWVTPT